MKFLDRFFAHWTVLPGDIQDTSVWLVTTQHGLFVREREAKKMIDLRTGTIAWRWTKDPAYGFYFPRDRFVTPDEKLQYAKDFGLKA